VCTLSLCVVCVCVCLCGILSDGSSLLLYPLFGFPARVANMCVISSRVYTCCSNFGFPAQVATMCVIEARVYNCCSVTFYDVLGCSVFTGSNWF
jgi:hypothetical protein